MESLFIAASLACCAGILLSSCSTSSSEKPQRGPDGTIAYKIQVESSHPGVRIEVDDDYIGTAPLTLTVFGDKDGTFHNFGSREYVIRAFPTTGTNQFPQTKVFQTGRWFSQEDKIPGRIYFDMTQKGGLFSIDLTPEK